MMMRRSHFPGMGSTRWEHTRISQSERFRLQSPLHRHIPMLSITAGSTKRSLAMFAPEPARKPDVPFKWSDVGVAEGEMNYNNELPSLKIAGSVSIASGFPRTITQNSFVFGDDLSFVHGAHTLRLGGSITRFQDNIDIIGLGSYTQFLSWPDFLLGLDAQSNGTEFSNVFASFDDFGLTYRAYRAWEGAAFAQDDYRVGKTLTLNFGLRYERIGQFGDNLGRNSSFDLSKADANPPPAGSLAGYIVASNFSGTLPAGVTRVNNPFGNYGDGQNTLGPRIGFSWQFLPSSSALVLRGGYGIYYSQPTGQAFYQNVFGAPYSEFRLNSGQSNATATFQSPFAQPFPTPESFPLFPRIFANYFYHHLWCRSRLSTHHGSAIFIERSDRIPQRLVDGSRVCRHPGNTLGASTFPQPSPISLCQQSHKGGDHRHGR